MFATLGFVRGIPPKVDMVRMQPRLGSSGLSRRSGSFGFAGEDACASILARGNRRQGWSAQGASAQSAPDWSWNILEAGTSPAILYEHRNSRQPLRRMDTIWRLDVRRKREAVEGAAQVAQGHFLCDQLSGAGVDLNTSRPCQSERARWHAPARDLAGWPNRFRRYRCVW
jgi:hypothetical protein